MSDQTQKQNFRYKYIVNDINYNIQLFNIQHEKIKIMIDTKNIFSDDYVEYSNLYSLVQFQEITRYYILFENIDEVFDDLAHTIQEKNFTLTHNGNTVTLTIKVMINKSVKNVDFILDKNKIIDLSSQNDNPQYYSKTFSSKNTEKYKNLEKSKRNIEISNINELNTLLSDLKDRITVLENSQHNLLSERNELPESKISNELKVNNLGASGDNLSLGLENILLRLSKLENDNNNKDKKIAKLESKLRYYESLDKTYNNNISNINNPELDNNYMKLSTVPTIKNTILKSQTIPQNSYNNYPLQFQKQSSLSYCKEERNNYTDSHNIYISDNNNINRSMKNYNNYNYNNQRLRQSKSQIFQNNNSAYYMDENVSMHSQETKKNNLRNNSYNDKRLFRENNKSFEEKDTYRSNKFNNENYPNNNLDIKSNNSNVNSVMSNYSNANDRNFQKHVEYKEKIGIPIVPRQNLKKYVNSRIIFTRTELKLLKNKLSEGNKKVHVFFDLLYRASTDGDFQEIVKKSYFNREKTLTLFYSYEGSRFGVYMQKRKATSFIKGKILKEVPGTSFIVSLNNLKFFDISPTKTAKEGHEDCLSFGRTFYLNANGSNWLIYTPRSKFLKKKCTIGNQLGEYYDFDPEVLVGSNYEYHLKDVEIFHVVFEKDEDDNHDNNQKK